MELMTSASSSFRRASAATEPVWLTVAQATATTVGVLLVGRAIKRSFFSPTIECKLQCPCGSIQGTLRAKREDSIRINCYCEDCRQYAKFIASLGTEKDCTPCFGQVCGETRVVQVCKNAVHLDKGQELLKLATKCPKVGKDGQKAKKVYMHRFYASCCHVPLFNTVDFLGFVGVFRDFLDPEAQEQFAGPVRLFPEEAWAPSEEPEKEVCVPDFLWKLLRYAPWSKAGPFNYQLEPVYWGEEKDTNGS